MIFLALVQTKVEQARSNINTIKSFKGPGVNT